MQFRKKIWFISVLLIVPAAVFYQGCNPQEETGKRQISVSIMPQKYFIGRISGDLFSINVLLPDGSSPATYDPLPSQINDIARSEIYFKMGYLGFEENWIPRIEKRFPELPVIDLSEKADLIHQPGDEAHHNHSHGTDPHYWLSVHNVRTVCAEITETLCKLEPSKEKMFRSNYAEFVTELDSLAQRASDLFSNLRTRKFIIYHPSLSYLAKDYNLTQIAIEHEGKEPSPRHITGIINLAKEEHIKHIFIQKEFDTESARSVAEEIDGEIVEIDPLDYNWLNNMHSMIEKLHDAMNQEGTWKNL